jgi:hypothetical protein
VLADYRAALNPAQRKFLWFMRLSVLWKVAALLLLLYFLGPWGGL